jgi:transcriptional regulator with XRE-family HTH domain
MSVHDRIRAARNEKSLSLNAFAKALGVTSTCTWNWEHENTTPRGPMLAKIAKVLDVDLAYLAAGLVDVPASRPATNTGEILEGAKSALATVLGVSPDRIKLELSVTT